MSPLFLLNDSTGGYSLPGEARPEEIIRFAQRLVADSPPGSPCMSDPRPVRQYLRLRLALLPHEVLFAVYLDSQHRIVASEEAFRGTIDTCAAYPREIVKAALSANAAAVIFAHNHPSGVPEPS